MADYITTYGGTHFTPLKPVAEEIHITDIAHALSLICRGNGHVKYFYSVAQHCISCYEEAVARGYSKKVCFACLLHDAAEAYMSDLTRPIKKSMPEYVAYEEALLAVIYKKYLGSVLTEPEEEQVRSVDDDLLYYDLVNLLEEIPEQVPPVLKNSFRQEFVPFEKVEERYLELFYECKNDI